MNGQSHATFKLASAERIRTLRKPTSFHAAARSSWIRSRASAVHGTI